MTKYASDLIASVKAKNPSEPEFHQAVQEVVESLELVIERHPEYRTAKILERIIEPERVILFRVPWMDDQGEIHVNRGFRIQMNSAIGPKVSRGHASPILRLGWTGRPLSSSAFAPAAILPCARMSRNYESCRNLRRLRF